jgi:hypothetical protein
LCVVASRFSGRQQLFIPKEEKEAKRRKERKKGM